MLTTTQKDTAQAIVNIFETSAVRGRYDLVTVMPGDSGHLTYGRSQTTLMSGNLHRLLERYCATPGARFAARLQPHMPRFKQKDLSLDADTPVHNLLRASADDVVMRDTQDTFFDEVYWRVALHSAGDLGIATPLGVAVVYDSTVHGSWDTIRDLTSHQHGSLAALGEHAWIKAYVQTRRQWLAGHGPADPLRKTVYRMDEFAVLIDLGCWGLELPLVVRNQEISTVSLHELPRGCYDGPVPGSRALAVQQPLARGLDVRLLQLGLSAQGMAIEADGIFGQVSAGCVSKYQQTHELPATGVADVVLIGRLTTG